MSLQWGKDRPPTGQFDGYSPQQAQTPGYPQTPSAYFPQYGGPGGPMTPQGGPHSSAASMSGYPTNHQSPLGPSPGGRGWGQDQGGFAGPGMAAQGYGQMPGSAGGYGRGSQTPGSQWGQPSAGGFGNVGNGFGGYQG